MLEQVIDDRLQVIFFIESICGMYAACITVTPCVVYHCVIPHFNKHVQVFDRADWVLVDSVSTYNPSIDLVGIDENTVGTVVSYGRDQYMNLYDSLEFIHIQRFRACFATFAYSHIPQYGNQYLARRVVTEGGQEND